MVSRNKISRLKSLKSKKKITALSSQCCQLAQANFGILLRTLTSSHCKKIESKGIYTCKLTINY